MKYLAAYMLCQSGGNAAPDAAAIKKVIEAVGAEADDEALTAFLAKMEGKDVDELVKAGAEKVKKIGAGGGGGGGGGGAGGADAGGDAGGAAAPEAEEEEEAAPGNARPLV